MYFEHARSITRGVSRHRCVWSGFRRGILLSVDHERWELSPADLLERAVGSKHRRTRERFLAPYEVVQGRCATDVAKEMGRDNETVHRWIHWFNDKGPDALLYQRSGGRPPFVRHTDSRDRGGQTGAHGAGSDDDLEHAQSQRVALGAFRHQYQWRDASASPQETGLVVQEGAQDSGQGLDRNAQRVPRRDADSVPQRMRRRPTYSVSSSSDCPATAPT